MKPLFFFCFFVLDVVEVKIEMYFRPKPWNQFQLDEQLSFQSIGENLLLCNSFDQFALCFGFHFSCEANSTFTNQIPTKELPNSDTMF